MATESPESNSSGKCQISFFYEYHFDSPFWAENEIAYPRFDVGEEIAPEELGLSAEISGQIRHMSMWHDTAINWNYPPNPRLWRQEECDRFNTAIDNLLASIRSELREEFEIIDRQHRYNEDPDLDTYLANPDTFHLNRPKRNASED